MIDGIKAPADVWARIAAPLPKDAISWRQDGKPVNRDGRFIARFVCYIEAGTVRERLDSVVPGEWDLTLTPLNDMVAHEGSETIRAFKARLQILGVVREDVGEGDSYKSAATDAFKRAAVRFGIGHELYQMEQLWVELDGDGKYAKPKEDPNVVYARRNGGRKVSSEGREDGNVLAMEGSDERTVRNASALQQSESGSPLGSQGGLGNGERSNGSGRVGSDASVRQSPVRESGSPSDRNTAREHSGRGAEGAHGNADEVACPKCGGRTWDNRKDKKNPRAPDFKCRDRSCDGVIWPPKPGDKQKVAANDRNFDDFPAALEDRADDLPF